jgi:cytochrome c oxidase subunit 4
MNHEQEFDYAAHFRKYMVVFFALVVGTILTVAVSYLHLPAIPALILALAIATTKGTLVALFFMHLIDERQVIYWVMAAAAFFFFFALLVPWITQANGIHVGGV